MRRLAIAIACVALGACGGGEPAVTGPVSGPVTVARFPAPVAKGSLRTLSLEGAVRGSGRVAVVFSHAFPETQASWASFAEKIAGRGFMTLTFNFRGYGLSEGTRDPSRADLDLKAAIREARRRGADTVLAVGASMGGTAAIKVAAREPLAGVVAVSAPASFRGLDARDDAARIRAPILFIAAEHDDAAPASARLLFDRAPEPKQLEIVRGSSAHGTDLLLDSKTAARVEALITAFLTANR